MRSSPSSKTELARRARAAARVSLGRAAFVRDARVLPIGVPIALGVAAVVYARLVQPRRDWRHPVRGRRPPTSQALGVAAITLSGALAIAYLEARLEWTLSAGRSDR